VAQKKVCQSAGSGIEANYRALQTGYFFGETTETFQQRYRIRPASLPPGTYRKVTGNEAMAMGLVTAAYKDGQAALLRHLPHHPGQRHSARAGGAAQF
jgi:2-oxoglutarate ferredoxin oxidoreductase subunit alpha